MELILEALLDAIKLFPFLLITYIILEYIEHKQMLSFERFITKSNTRNTITGAFTGIFPQCGFSLIASNLFAKGFITIGTLLAVFITTSDEMIPILILYPSQLPIIVMIVLIKIVVAILFGITIDFFIRHKDKHSVIEYHDHCQENYILSALKHSMQIFIFIFLTNVLLNIMIQWLGVETFTTLVLKDSIFQPILAAAIGLIPNCFASILLCELFLSNTIGFAALLAGLISGAGVGIAVLFRINSNKKENCFILLLLFVIASFVGMITQFII